MLHPLQFLLKKTIGLLNMLFYKLKSLFIIFFFALQSFCVFGDDDDTKKLNEKIDLIRAQTPEGLWPKCLLIFGRNYNSSLYNALALHLNFSRSFQVRWAQILSISEIPTLSEISDHYYDVIIISAHGDERFLNPENNEAHTVIIENLLTLTNHLTPNGIFILSSFGQTFNVNALRSASLRAAARRMQPTQMLAYSSAPIADLRATDDRTLRFMNNEEAVPTHVLSGSQKVAIRPIIEYRSLQFAASLILFYFLYYMSQSHS